MEEDRPYLRWYNLLFWKNLWSFTTYGKRNTDFYRAAVNRAYGVKQTPFFIMAEMKKKLIVIGAFSLLSAIWGVWIILKFSFFGAVAENSDSLQKDWELECSNGHSLNIEINYAGMNQNYRTVDIYCKNYAGESSPPIKCQFDTHSEILYTKDSNGLTFLSNGNPKGECTFTCCEKVKLKIVKSTELRKTKNGIPQNGYVEIK